MDRILIMKQLYSFSDGPKTLSLNLFLFSLFLEEISGRSHSFSSPSQSLEKSYIRYENKQINEIRTIFSILQVKSLSLQLMSDSDMELFSSRAWNEHLTPLSLLIPAPRSSPASVKPSRGESLGETAHSLGADIL